MFSYNRCTGLNSVTAVLPLSECAHWGGSPTPIGSVSRCIFGLAIKDCANVGNSGTITWWK